MFCYLKTSQNQFAIIDVSDMERVRQFKWFYNVKDKKSGAAYIQRNAKIYDKNGKVKRFTEYLHRFILNLKRKDKRIVDHINNNPLDNRKENLRIVSQRINARNCYARKKSTSNYVGVHFHKLTNKWRAQIKLNTKNVVSLGLFTTQEEAYLSRLEYIKTHNLQGFKRK
jgi:hypothetical protein